VDNTQQLFFAIIYLKKFVLAVVVALPSYMLKVPIPCGRKPEYPEKTHDFRQTVDGLFSLYGYHNVHNGNRTHEIRGERRVP
jgi:hypothetical protein